MPQSSHWLPKCWGNRVLTIIIHPFTPGANYVGHMVILSFYEWWRKVKISVIKYLNMSINEISPLIIKLLVIVNLN